MRRSRRWPRVEDEETAPQRFQPASPCRLPVGDPEAPAGTRKGRDRRVVGAAREDRREGGEAPGHDHGSPLRLHAPRGEEHLVEPEEDHAQPERELDGPGEERSRPEIVRARQRALCQVSDARCLSLATESDRDGHREHREHREEVRRTLSAVVGARDAATAGTTRYSAGDMATPARMARQAVAPPRRLFLVEEDQRTSAAPSIRGVVDGDTSKNGREPRRQRRCGIRPTCGSRGAGGRQVSWSAPRRRRVATSRVDRPGGSPRTPPCRERRGAAAPGSPLRCRHAPRHPAGLEGGAAGSERARRPRHAVAHVLDLLALLGEAERAAQGRAGVCDGGARRSRRQFRSPLRSAVSPGLHGRRSSLDRPHVPGRGRVGAASGWSSPMESAPHRGGPGASESASITDSVALREEGK